MGLCQSNNLDIRPFIGNKCTNHANKEDKRYLVVEKSRGYGAGGFEELRDGFKKNKKKNSGLLLWQT